MLALREKKGHPSRRDVEERELPTAPKVQPQGKFSNIEFKEAISIIDKVVTNQFWK